MSSAPWSPSPDFARLFRSERFRFEFGMRPAESSWFRLADPQTPELAQRAALARDYSADHLPWRPEANPALDELLELFAAPTTDALRGGGSHSAQRLAGIWEPDFVLLRRGSDRVFRLAGACVCDPSWWNPEEKLGLPVEAIHDPVPTLNPELGARIRTFLDRLPAGATFTRENWGLAAVPDRNLHPRLARPRLTPKTSLNQVWLRVEHQAFRALPRSASIVFVIWLTVHPLADALANAETAAAFFRQLTTMPEEIARYKGLAEARPSLLSQLSARPPEKPVGFPVSSR